MNKNKKELYEENKKLKKDNCKLDKENQLLFEENLKMKQILETYYDFWEIDAIVECVNQLKNTKKILYIISTILLIISAFLLGLCWGC